MTFDMDMFERIIGSVTIFVFVVSSIVLFVLIMHLIYKTYKKYKKKRTPTTNKLISILIATIIGISSFEISLLCTIIVVVQIFLLDDIIKDEVLIPSDFFFATYAIFEYLIAVFDSFGHLVMLFVFIARFKYAFKNEIFNQSKLMIHSMYIILIILFIMSLVIMIYIFPSTTEKTDLLIWEIIWEICVESMVLLILGLFISNLYKLLRLSLFTHMKNGNNTDFLTEVTKISLERSRSSGKGTKSGKKNKSESKITMTIDGQYVDPISINKSSQKTMSHKSYVDDAEHEENHDKASKVTSQEIEVISLMNKMTLLVIVAAVGSLLTIIGNLIIEIYGNFNEKDIGTDRGLDRDALWVFILPVVDIVITSFMLYFQFIFTHNIYRGMCRCLDTVFLKCMIGIIICFWLKSQDEKTASFIIENNKNITELETKSSTINTNNQTQSNEDIKEPETNSNHQHIQIELNN